MHVARIVAAVSAVALSTVAFHAHADAKVRTVLLDAHGRPSGVILDDGRELVGEPNEKLTQVATPGDPVRVELGAGDRLVLINSRTEEGATLGPREEVDLAPLYARPVAFPIGVGGGPQDTNASRELRYDDARSLFRFASLGRVSLVLKAPSGAPSGLLMEDGTQVQIVPRLAGVLAKIQPGASLRVEGVGTHDEHGSSMWGLSITSGRYVYLDAERGVGVPELSLAARAPR